MDWNDFFKFIEIAFTALFPLINPIGSVPAFSGLTANDTPEFRRAQARKSSVNVVIILIVGSIGVLTYFQSEQSSFGNSINIAGKNRYLTSNLLLQTEKYLDGSSDASQ